MRESKAAWVSMVLLAVASFMLALNLEPIEVSTWIPAHSGQVYRVYQPEEVAKRRKRRERRVRAKQRKTLGAYYVGYIMLSYSIKYYDMHTTYSCNNTGTFYIVYCMS